jgi:predicted amidophosphoribosyltransferase
LLVGSLRVRSAYLHRNAARALVHNFKYRGIEPAGRLLAAAMTPLIPDGSVLIPLPRAGWRRLRYGIDPAPSLAAMLASSTGYPVLRLLEMPFLTPSQARVSRSHRNPPMFFSSRGRQPLPREGPLVLIDDVITTGGTLTSAKRSIELNLGSVTVLAVTATNAGND